MGTRREAPTGFPSGTTSATGSRLKEKLHLWGKTAKSSRMGWSLECIRTLAATNCGTGRAGSTTRLCVAPRDFTLLVTSELEKSQKLRQNILKIATKYLEIATKYLENCKELRMWSSDWFSG